MKKKILALFSSALLLGVGALMLGASYRDLIGAVALTVGFATLMLAFIGFMEK